MSHSAEQFVFKNEVKQWLRSRGLDYKWMADQCGVSEITVRNWMSQKSIPILKQQLIRRVMRRLPGTSASFNSIHMSGVEVDTALTLTVKLCPSLYSKLEDKAAKQGYTIGELVAQSISELIQE